MSVSSRVYLLNICIVCPLIRVCVYVCARAALMRVVCRCGHSCVFGVRLRVVSVCAAHPVTQNTGPVFFFYVTLVSLIACHHGDEAIPSLPATYRAP